MQGYYSDGYSPLLNIKTIISMLIFGLVILGAMWLLNPDAFDSNSEFSKQKDLREAKMKEDFLLKYNSECINSCESFEFKFTHFERNGWDGTEQCWCNNNGNPVRVY